MKKRILAMLLSSFLMLNANACNGMSDAHTSEEGGVPTTSTTGKANAEAQIVAEGSIPCNGNDHTIVVYQINENGEVTLQIDAWNEEHLVVSVSLASDTEIEVFRRIGKAIAVSGEHACLFLKQSEKITVIRLEKGSSSETVTSLDAIEDMVGMAGCFINESTGYFFAFKEVSDYHARGGAKLSSLLITENGGNTWSSIDVQSVPSISLREYIMFAKMVSKDVGLISGSFFAADYDFCERTLLTTDGGHHWVNVSDLPQINELQLAIVTDFAQVDNDYVLTVRYTASEASGEYGYAEYRLIDQSTWVRVS